MPGRLSISGSYGALQPAEYLIERFKASSSPYLSVTPSSTPPKYGDLSFAAIGVSGLGSSTSLRGSFDRLSDAASRASADGYINDCIKASETICLERGELPDGSQLWHAVMEELSPRHSMENIRPAGPSDGEKYAGLLRESDAYDGGQRPRARANTMPSSANADASQSRGPGTQRVRFA